MAEKPFYNVGGKITKQHGGEGMIKALAAGTPFSGLALETYNEVLAEIAVPLDTLTGLERVLVERAARFEATARVFDAAAMGAANIGNLKTWERLQQRAGWIGGKAFAALKEIKDMVEERQPHVADYEEILEQQRNG